MTKGVAVGLAPGVWGFMVLNTKGAQRALKKGYSKRSAFTCMFSVLCRSERFQISSRVKG